MNGDPYIPQKTRDAMANGAVKGDRHATMFKIAMPLIGAGMADQAVFAQLRSTFPDADKSDKELLDVISWCRQKNPEPSGYGDHAERPAPHKGQQRPLTIQKPAAPKLTPKEAIERALGGRRYDEAWWTKRSNPPVPVEPQAQTKALLEALYNPNDKINFVKEFFIGDDEKAKPHGGGRSCTRDTWLASIEKNGVPVSDSGIWVRPNPCGAGSGKDGAITDADILDWRFAFLESDILTVEEQLSFYSRSGLPIAAIISSGGDSCHAWVRIDAGSLEEYRERVKALYAVIEQYGMDKANKNASRLSRLAGARRVLGLPQPAIQRLIYLNRDARRDVLTQGFLEKMAARLSKPPTNEFPLNDAVYDATLRYDELMKNVGKNGLPTGFPKFDTLTGGFKKKRLYVLAAESKCGKSSMAYNIAFNGAQKGKRMAIFSMEMDQAEVVDMLVSRDATVDRNGFNTGKFTSAEFQGMKRLLPDLGRLPIHIFDNPLQTIETIRDETLSLKEEMGVDLVIVDYLQLVTPMSDRESREQQIATIGMGLRRLCVDADVPVLALSQINDEGKLRESRAVGHMAHAVLILDEIDPSEGAEKRFLRLRIERARAMPRGVFPIVFEPYHCRMYEGDHSTERVETVKQDNLKGKKFRK